jgi:hypothetical protein
MIRARARRLPRTSHAMPKRGRYRVMVGGCFAGIGQFTRIAAVERERVGHRISATVSMKIEQMVSEAAFRALFGGS